jgi:hypothetical protein
MAMPPMLAYTIQTSQDSGYMPLVIVGQGAGQVNLKPNAPVDDSYWFCILDANKPTNKVTEFIVPGNNNAAVPTGLDAYMSNPAYIIALATQYLSTLHVPQGAFYTYLAQHGAGRELQRLEQINTTLGCGRISRMSYCLTLQGGNTFGYEKGATSPAAMIMMSLMPLPSGQPPYSLCDSYTFNT